MENIKLDVIECPTCHAQYLPAEIYLPNVFFGRPAHVERDSSHQIVSVSGSNMNVKEQYICDYCQVPFKVTTKLQFVTKAETKFNFNDEYTTKLKKESIFLQED